MIPADSPVFDYRSRSKSGVVSDRGNLEVANEAAVLESGKTVWKESAREARRSADMIDALLGLKETDPHAFLLSVCFVV